MSEQYKIAVIGAGGKMGMRVSNNLARTAHPVAYVENSPAGRERTITAGRELTGPEPLYLRAPDVTLPAPRKRVGS